VKPIAESFRQASVRHVSS